MQELKKCYEVWEILNSCTPEIATAIICMMIDMVAEKSGQKPAELASKIFILVGRVNEEMGGIDLP